MVQKKSLPVREGFLVSKMIYQHIAFPDRYEIPMTRIMTKEMTVDSIIIISLRQQRNS